ncbi:hypothetical protein D018_4237B, partial [Vibrio parahaemolyticus VP2007-007]
HQGHQTVRHHLRPSIDGCGLRCLRECGQQSIPILDRLLIQDLPTGQSACHSPALRLYPNLHSARLAAAVRSILHLATRQC